MYNTTPIKEISYFSADDYDSNELESFMNNVVFTKKITSPKSFTPAQLPLTKTLVNNFNLSCLFESKLSKNTCNHYLGIFFERFFVYAISVDYPGLQNIFDVVKNTPSQKEELCA